MATTTNFGWETPDDTDLVKDGASAMRTLGSAIDASLMDLKGGSSGQVLAKNSGTDMDFTWVEQDDTTLTISTKTADYTLAAGDKSTLIRMNSGTAKTFTVPASTFSTGNEIHIQGIGAGVVHIVAGSGVTITSTGLTSSAPDLRTQFSAATIVCVGSDSFTVVGDLA